MKRPLFCYVSIPYGTQSSPDSPEPIDFDSVYHDLILPVVEEAGLKCVRGDELEPSSIVQSEILRAVVESMLMIVDVTTLNPNVFYELGIRHALTPSRTILLRRQNTRLPFNISMVRAVDYSYPFEQADRTRIKQAVDQALSERTPSSPLYLLVPELKEDFPGVLSRAERLAALWATEQRGPRETAEAVLTRSGVEQIRSANSSGELSAVLEKISTELTSEAPELVGEAIRGYRKLSDWEGLINFAERLDPEIGGSKEVAQEVAWALLRRGSPGDLDKALKVASGLLDRQGDAPEVLALLGRIHRERFSVARNEADLEQSIGAYQRAFDLNPRETYAGLQVLDLLAMKGDEAAVHRLLPRVEKALVSNNEGYPLSAWSFWDVASQLDLSIMARDWETALEAASILARNPDSQRLLMPVVTRLESWSGRLPDDESREHLRTVLARLGGKENA